MYLIAEKTVSLAGQITVPSSKSESVRALIIALLTPGKTTLANVLHADDTQHASQICQQLGATITAVHTTDVAANTAQQLIIESTGLPIQTNATQLHSGNSGITTRFIMPILGLRQHTQQPIILDCGEQMRARPVASLVIALRNLGLHIDYLGKENQLPIAISGDLIGGNTEIDGVSSQYLSALLIALPCAQKDSVIRVKNLHSRAYIAMTLNCLQQHHIRYQHQQTNDVDMYHIPGRQQYQPFNATIAGDFSSASCLLAAAALTQSEITLHGLNMQDPQGDKRLIDILKSMGADITIQPDSLIIRGGKPLKGLTIDANDIPDLVPALAVIGTQARGQTDIINVKQARLKETDRIHSMTAGLRHLGAKIEEHADGMTIYHSTLHGAQVKGHDDHRTVMALSVAGLLADGATIIEDGEAINKTFPHFVELMQAIGAQVKYATRI
jgi:3-phosphoshikimate 1-carboxyvinyltransferase